MFDDIFDGEILLMYRCRAWNSFIVHDYTISFALAMTMMILMNWIWCDSSHFSPIKLCALLLFALSSPFISIHHRLCSVSIQSEAITRRFVKPTWEVKFKASDLVKTITWLHMSIKRQWRWQWLKELKSCPMIKCEWIMSFINDSAVNLSNFADDFTKKRRKKMSSVLINSSRQCLPISLVW